MVMRYIVVIVLTSGLAGIAAQSPTQEFEVASIRRNITDALTGVGARPNAPMGEVRLVRVPARVLVLRAFPLELAPPQIVGLPNWAATETTT